LVDLKWHKTFAKMTNKSDGLLRFKRIVMHHIFYKVLLFRTVLNHYYN